MSASESVRGDSFGTCGMCPSRQLTSELVARDRCRFTRGGGQFLHGRRVAMKIEDHIGHVDAMFLFSAGFNKT